MAEAVSVVDEKQALIDAGRIEAELNESAAWRAWRLEALEAYLGSPLPDRVAHLWRYTDPSRLLPADPTGTTALQSMAEVPSPPEGGAVVVLHAGGPPTVVLSSEAAEAGLAVVPLSSIEPKDGDAGRAVPAGHGLFEALNAAAWRAGGAVLVPRGTTVPGPVHVVVPAVAGAWLPRLLVRAGDLSEVTVVEDHLGGGEESRVVSVTEISAAAGAAVRHVLLQRWAEGTRGHVTTRARLERDARLATVLASFGGSVVKMDLGAAMEGPGSRSEVVGFVLGEDRQHMDHHTVHNHRAHHTSSDIDFKVALTDRARSAYTGLIRIEEGAPVTEAFQENRNLLLSENCRAETIPELEILTDDVQCSHGATVAPMDPAQLFYLESRGIPPRTAERLIVRGFLEATLARVPEALRGPVETLVEERLERFLGGQQ